MGGGRGGKATPIGVILVFKGSYGAVRKREMCHQNQSSGLSFILLLYAFPVAGAFHHYVITFLSLVIFFTLKSTLTRR